MKRFTLIVGILSYLYVMPGQAQIAGDPFDLGDNMDLIIIGTCKHERNRNCTPPRENPPGNTVPSRDREKHATGAANLYHYIETDLILAAGIGNESVIDLPEFQMDDPAGPRKRLTLAPVHTEHGTVDLLVSLGSRGDPYSRPLAALSDLSPDETYSVLISAGPGGFGIDIWDAAMNPVYSSPIVDTDQFDPR